MKRSTSNRPSADGRPDESSMIGRSMNDDRIPPRTSDLERPKHHTCRNRHPRRNNKSALPIACLVGLVWVLGPAHLASAQAAYDCTIQTEIPVVECEALVNLYTNTTGSSWSNSSGWLATTTPCSWFGVTCSSGHVTSLILHWNGLVGSIPETIGNLAHLTVLDLGVNVTGPEPALTGPIPESIGNLTHLRELLLPVNQLTGSIPASIGNLSELNRLLLSDNGLTGPIPESLGNLSNLHDFELDENHLSGPIPESLCKLNPWNFWLYGNELTGIIPECLSTMAEVRWLVIGGNHLEGTIPESIGNLPNLTLFHAGKNMLTGPIPPTLGNLAQPGSQIDLRENQLGGSVPLLIAHVPDCRLADNPDLCVPDIPEYQALATDGKVCGLPLDPECPPIVHVEAKAFLEGPYSDGSMQTSSMFSDHRPTAQPYSDPIFDGTPLEYDEPDVVASFPDSVIDWVLVSLRTGIARESEVAGSERAALLLTNGSVVDTAGRILAFPGIAPDPYRLVVRHRNHASVMSADTLGLSDGYGTWDFSTSVTQAYSDGGVPMKQLDEGRFGMFACDVIVDGQISAPDFLLWQAKTGAGASGYEQADCNLDGDVTAPDFNLWNANTTAGASSQVPD